MALDIINQSHPLDWELAAANGIPGYGAAALELVQRDSGSGNSASPRPTSIVAGEAAAELAELGVVSLSGALLPPDTWAVAGEAAEAALPLISGAGLPYQYLSALSSQTASVTTTPAAGQTAGGTAASTRQPELDWLFCVMPTPDMQSELFFTYLRQLNQTEMPALSRSPLFMKIRLMAVRCSLRLMRRRRMLILPWQRAFPIAQTRQMWQKRCSAS